MQKILERARVQYRNDKARPQHLVNVTGDYIEHSNPRVKATKSKIIADSA